MTTVTLDYKKYCYSENTVLTGVGTIKRQAIRPNTLF